jgi:two-component SAPR family response regulator
MNGKELFARIRKIVPEMHILYMSGYTANVIAYQGVLDADAVFLQKPFSFQELRKKIDEAVPHLSS